MSTGEGLGGRESLSGNTPTPPHLTSTWLPYLSLVSVVLTCSAAPRSRAPASPMSLFQRLPIWKCDQTAKVVRLAFRKSNTPSPPYTTSPHLDPHAHAHPALLQHWPSVALSLGHRNCTTHSHRSITSSHRHPHPFACKLHFNVISVVLSCSAAPRSRTPAAPMLLFARLSRHVQVSALARHGGPLSATATLSHPHRLIPYPISTSASSASC
jgi:hypothetical protein